MLHYGWFGLMAIGIIWTPIVYMLRKVMLKKKNLSPSISIHSFVGLFISDIHHSIPCGIFFVCVSMASDSLITFILFFSYLPKITSLLCTIQFNFLIYASPVYMLRLLIQIKDFPIVKIDNTVCD